MSLSSDPRCGMEHPDGVPDPTVTVKDGRLASVVVWVSKGTDRWTFTPPAEAARMELARCLLVPHVLSVQTRQGVAIRNVSTCDHGIHLVSRRNPESNQVVSRYGKEKVFDLPEAELGVRFKCDVHSWVRACVAVFDHPFHGVTDDRGKAFLRLPPGEFEISVWHEYGKFATPAPQVVRVGDGGTPEIEFVYEAK